MVNIINNEKETIIRITKESKPYRDFITCSVLASYRKFDYNYIPLFSASISVDFSYAQLSSFLKDLKQFSLFNKLECCLYDVEKSFILKMYLSRETGHVLCDCTIGNGNYGKLTFSFEFDQTMTDDLITGFSNIILDGC